MYKVLSLFSGIAGLCELGIAAAGLQEQFQVTQFVENNEYCQKVLSKRFPTIPIWGDIRTYNPERGEFDVFCGGFPCQNISSAGKREGIRGDRSGLFFEIIRLVRVVRPQYILLENVANLLANGMGEVLAELSECGCSVEWSLVSAAEVGAVHKRERIFIIAHTQSAGWGTSRCDDLQARTDVASISCGANVANKSSTGLSSLRCSQSARQSEFGRSPNNKGAQTQPHFRGENARIPGKLDRNLMSHEDLPKWLPKATDSDGIPYRKERLMALGNAVCPQQGAIAWKRLAQIAGVER